MCLSCVVSLVSDQDLTTVRLLAETTKKAAELACAIAVEGRIVALGALLMVAAEKIVEWSVEILDTDSGSMEKMTIFECVVREALSMGGGAKAPSKTAKTSCFDESENAEKKKLILCEIELLQIFGAVAQSSRTDKRVTSPLILAVRVSRTFFFNKKLA